MVDEAFAGVQGQLGTAAACRLTGRPRHPLPLPQPEVEARPVPEARAASALSPAERAETLALLNRPEYVDLPPPAPVWARELDVGNYWCSERTMYRILSAAGQNGECRRQAAHPPGTIPELVATGPSQVFTWDITRCPARPRASGTTPTSSSTSSAEIQARGELSVQHVATRLGVRQGAVYYWIARPTGRRARRRRTPEYPLDQRQRGNLPPTRRTNREIAHQNHSTHSRRGSMKPPNFRGDRTAQAAPKQVLEPNFEAGFLPVSYGWFRPKRRAQDAIAEIQRFGTKGYRWVLDADIEAAFDNVSRCAIMDAVRARVKDKRVLALVKAFLKSGLLTEDGRHRDTCTGTPQGGVLSPLIFNIALSTLDEHLHRDWKPGGRMDGQYPRRKRSRHGLPNWRIVRYADDFSILVHGSADDARALQDEVTSVLESLGLRLAPAKAGSWQMEEVFDFLGFRIQWKRKRGTASGTSTRSSPRGRPAR
ncbi:reverse transcriptase domain-containing protein [Streptomyces sp. NPDC007856]|uniref:reverse transcriptase domain-containing protein n=1 Tax=Streptomyces sp. NPDC007856 TaxID=3364781 RepID=UPI00368F1516